MGQIYETFAGRYEQSPSLGDERKTCSDARKALLPRRPCMVLEVDQSNGTLPSRVYDALQSHSQGRLWL